MKSQQRIGNQSRQAVMHTKTGLPGNFSDSLSGNSKSLGRPGHEAHFKFGIQNSNRGIDESLLTSAVTFFKQTLGPGLSV